MSRSWSLLVTLLSVPAAASPGSSVEVRGSLLREGKPLDFAKAPLFAAGTRCREEDEKGLSLSLRLPASASRYHVEDTVLSIRATPGRAPLGKRLVPQTSDRSYDSKRDAWGRVLAWISPAGRASQATLPDKGWVRFKALERKGPIEVELELDFGALGKIAGRARAATTEETVCRIPAPPPPPPPPPPPR